jgi:uncharacterized protein (DUF2252 family)
LFYDRLPRGGVFKSAPTAWLCGDLHLENFGSYKGDNRLVYFDINDFDEAVLAPASWDLVRFLTSLRLGLDRVAKSDETADSLCRTFLDAYGAALALGKAYWVERETAQGLVRQLLDGLRDRSRPTFLDGHTTIARARRALRVDGKKALPASDTQRILITEFMREFARGQPDPKFFDVLDVARRVAGTGSLGLDRYVILVEGKGSPDGNYLLDLKQAMPSALRPNLGATQPRWKTEAHRIVALQRREQAVSSAFLQPVLVAEAPYVLRALQPAEDRIALTRPRRTLEELRGATSTMGSMVAWAQLRGTGRDGSAIADELIEFARRKKWKAQLLDASRECATQVRADAAAFNVAWDDGALGG